MPIIISDAMPHRKYRGILDTGNYNPAYIPAAADYVYVDLNAVVNGNGLTSSTPRNTIPPTLATGQQLLFNSDNGIQSIPPQDVAISIQTGTDIQISSYGSSRAILSGYQYFTSGWTKVGTSNVWQRTYAGGTSAAGPVVGNVVDMTTTVESPQGYVLNW